MARLFEQVAILTTLIKAEHTLEAMKRFYADDVIMWENEQPLRILTEVSVQH